jgi:hypothetical protein
MATFRITMVFFVECPKNVFFIIFFSKSAKFYIKPLLLSTTCKKRLVTSGNLVFVSCLFNQSKNLLVHEKQLFSSTSATGPASAAVLAGYGCICSTERQW